MASEFLTTHAESSFTMRPRSSRRAARRLASAARRFLVPASLGLLAILGLNDTAYTFQGRAMTAVASPPFERSKRHAASRHLRPHQASP